MTLPQVVSSYSIRIGKGDRSEGFGIINVKDYQNLHRTEDNLCDVVLCLEFNLDTQDAFVESCKHLRISLDDVHSSSSVSLATPKGSGSIFFALKRKRREVVYTRKKAKTILAKARNTRDLVSLSLTWRFQR